MSESLEPLSVKPLEHRNLQNFLIRCCYHYYVMAEPIISDRYFDEEFKRLQRMEEKNGAAVGSPTQMIYGDVESQYPDWVTD